MWVTTIYEDGTEEERRQLSAKMAHSQRAAQLWYDLTEKKTEATEGFKVMEKKLDSFTKSKPTESPTKASPMKKSKRKRVSWEKDDEAQIISSFQDVIKRPILPNKDVILALFKIRLEDI